MTDENDLPMCRCGKRRCQINFETGKPYAHCLPCREHRRADPKQLAPARKPFWAYSEQAGK